MWDLGIRTEEKPGVAPDEDDMAHKKGTEAEVKVLTLIVKTVVYLQKAIPHGTQEQPYHSEGLWLGHYLRLGLVKETITHLETEEISAEAERDGGHALEHEHEFCGEEVSIARP